jgi:hypothetical protein
VAAWGDALQGELSADSHGSGDDDSALVRLSELNPVMHAIEVVPTRVPYLYGESLIEVLYSPIPRLIWRDKPTMVDRASQRYAVIFGIQTERGAQSTAIGMNLLVEAFWNFGWFGVGLWCFASGLIPGVSQTLFAGRHWALRAVGIAQIACLTISGTAVNTYSVLFQNIVARFIAVWGIFWVAQALSGRPATRRMASHRAAGRRVA